MFQHLPELVVIQVAAVAVVVAVHLVALPMGQNMLMVGNSLSPAMLP
jgi:hypothetical protein